MLLLQQPVLALQLLQPADLSNARSLRPSWRHLRDPRPQTPFTKLLTPLRQHERVDVERLGHRLDLNPRSMTQLHRRSLELHSVPRRLLRSCSRHPTPPWLGGSVYFIEGRSAVGCTPWLGDPLPIVLWLDFNTASTLLVFAPPWT